MVIIGPPGAGKDTQGEFIAKKYRLKILSVGKILREQVKKNCDYLITFYDRPGKKS